MFVAVVAIRTLFPGSGYVIGWLMFIFIISIILIVNFVPNKYFVPKNKRDS